MNTQLNMNMTKVPGFDMWAEKENIDPRTGQLSPKSRLAHKDKGKRVPLAPIMDTQYHFVTVPTSQPSPLVLPAEEVRCWLCAPMTSLTLSSPRPPPLRHAKTELEREEITTHLPIQVLSSNTDESLGARVQFLGWGRS